MPLNIKQAKFVSEYVKSGNATDAAILAGYSKKTAHAIGHENLEKPAIKEAIEKKQNKILSKIDVKTEEIVKAFVDISQKYKDGNPRNVPLALKALENLCKIMGLFTENKKIEHDFKTPHRILVDWLKETKKEGE